jgi:hypothetical protein
MDIEATDLLAAMFAGGAIPTSAPVVEEVSPVVPLGNMVNEQTEVVDNVANTTGIGVANTTGIGVANTTGIDTISTTWEEALPIGAVAPCPDCGSLELWFDFWGGAHCQHCQSEGYQRSRQLLVRAARLAQGPNHRTLHHPGRGRQGLRQLAMEPPSNVL